MDTTIFLTNCLEQHKQKKGGKRKFSPRYYDGKFYGIFCTSSSNLYGSANRVCHKYVGTKRLPRRALGLKIMVYHDLAIYLK